MIYLPVTEETPETTNVSISIQDENDEPISGATVSIGTVSSVTGSAGGCTLQNVPVGTRTITVTADNYETLTESVIISDEYNNFNFILQEAEGE